MKEKVKKGKKKRDSGRTPQDYFMESIIKSQEQNANEKK